MPELVDILSNLAYNKDMWEIFNNAKTKIKLHKRKDVKIGLALGGGGARGYAHLGAIKAFEEYGLKFDYVAGTSAGALVGAFYANGWKFSQIFDMAREFKKKDLLTSKIPLMPSKTEGLENILISQLGDMDISETKIPFSAVAVDILSTEECIITKGNLAKAVAGSCAVPAIFQPVEFGGRLFFDGGLQNTLPANVPKLFGCDYVVAVDVNPGRNYGAKSGKYFDAIGAVIRILMRRNVEDGYENADVVLQPETKRFKSTKLDNIEDMVEEGYRAALDKMPEILALFNKRPISNRKKKELEHNATII